MLKIQNLEFYKNGSQILKNINISIKPGKIYFLLGSSGSGKSTIFRLLNKLENPTNGSILINEIDIKNSTKHLISMVFQQWYVFEHMKIEDNIDLPLKYTKKIDSFIKRKDIIDALLKEFDLFEHKGKYGSELSGGQKQRLAIARALSVAPQYVCLDEPTSALDPLLIKIIANYFKNIVEKNIGLIIATHDILLLRYFENANIFFLHEGSIVEQTTYAEFNKNHLLFPLLSNYLCENK